MAREAKNYDLTEGVIWKKLLQFFFPILFGTLFQQFYNTVDAIIVGKFVGTTALAAVGGSAATIINLIVGFFIGIGGGAMVAVSQFYGARDRKKLSETIHTAVMFCIICGAILTVAGILFARPILELMHNPPDTMEESVTYLRIYFIGTIAVLFFNVGSGILRAVGDSRSPLYYLIVCCGLNILLDIVFVLVCKWGVAGVAWATIISITVSAVLVFINLCTTDAVYRVHIKQIRVHGEALKRILYLGIPAGVQSAMFAFSNMLIQVAVNNLGSVTVAAWTACGKVDGVFWSTSNSFGVALSAFVAQAFGARKYERMRKSVRTCLYMLIGTSAAFSTLMLALAPFGARLFSNDQAVIELTTRILFFFVPYYAVWSFIEVFASTLRSVGETIRPMIISILGICVLRILWIIFVLPRWNTIDAISYSYPVSWGVTALIYSLYYKFGHWFDRCVKNLDAAQGEARG